MDLEKIKDEIRKSALLLQAETFPGTTTRPQGDGATDAGTERRPYIPHLRLTPLSFQPEFHTAFRSEIRYRELARYEGREFVRNAYLAILRHGPDPAGERFYLNMLRRGRSKVEIILRLRLGAEGRAQKAKVRGLIPAAALEGILMIPVLGYALRVVGGLLLLPRELREIRLRQEMLKDHLNDLSDKTRDTMNRVVGELNRSSRTSTSDDAIRATRDEPPRERE